MKILENKKSSNLILIKKKIKKFKKYRFIPDTNIKLNHTEEINKVCPISGCKINNIKIGKTMQALSKNLK